MEYSIIFKELQLIIINRRWLEILIEKSATKKTYKNMNNGFIIQL